MTNKNLDQLVTHIKNCISIYESALAVPNKDFNEYLYRRDELKSILTYLGIPDRKISGLAISEREFILNNYEIAEKAKKIIENEWTESICLDSGIIILTNKKDAELIRNNHEFFNDILCKVIDCSDKSGRDEANKLFYSYFTEESYYMN